jgi:hypothetical protein
LNQPAAVDVLSILLTLFALMIVTFASWIVWSAMREAQLRRGRGAENSERASRRAQLAAGIGALAALALIGVLLRFLGVAHHVSSSGGARPGLPPSVKIPQGKTLPFSWTAGGITAMIVVVGLALLFAVPRLWRTWRRRSAPDFAQLGERETPELVLSRHAPQGDLLAGVRVASPEDEPDPRRAVVAAWIAMTAAMAAIFTPRLDSEAPREYLERALEEAGVLPASAERLTDLFEEARFGGHKVGEMLRIDAIQALARVRGELAAHSPGTPTSARAASTPVPAPARSGV